MKDQFATVSISTPGKVFTNQTVWATILILSGSICFSSKSVLVKMAYWYDIDSVSLLTLRMVFSTPFYLAIALFYWKKNPELRISRKDSLQIIGLGISGYYLASLSDYMSLKYITAGMARLILFTYPTLVVLISAFFFRTKITSKQIIALFVTYAGIGLAFWEFLGVTLGNNIGLGVLLSFLAALSYAIYLIGSGQLLPKLGTWLFTSLAISVAGVVIILHHGLFYHWKLFHFHPNIYWISLMTAIFATVLPTLLISEGIRIIGSSNASIIASIGPVSTLVLAYFFLGESMGWMQIIGTIIVIVGVWIISKKGK